MKILAIMAVMGMTARAEHNVTVYVENNIDTRGAMYQAEVRAAECFAEIGVQIAWRAHSLACGRPPNSQRSGDRVIAVSLLERAPADYCPGALAEAEAFEGVHVTLFWDRIARQGRIVPVAVVLAHVLVHEITHILQGMDHHSESGVMKAQWTVEDFRAMEVQPLPFTPLDVELIQRGLAGGVRVESMSATNERSLAGGNRADREYCTRGNIVSSVHSSARP